MLALATTLALIISMMIATGMTSFAAVGNDGKITITNATAGQTYKAFLIFTANPSDSSDITKGVSYTATASQIAVAGFSDIFDTHKDANGNYTVSKKNGVSDDDVVDFIKNNIDALKQSSAITGSFTTDSKYEFTNLTYGYYYVTSSLGSVVTIDTAAKEATVVDKNESAPEEPGKEITAEVSAIHSGQNNSTVTHENDASVGSTESFAVTFKATNWTQSTGTGTKTQITEWNFKDAPIGLDIIKSTVKVLVNVGTTAEVDVTNTISDIDVDTNGVLTFTIPWVDDNGNSLYETQTSGSALIPVKVTYDAKVNDRAAYRTAPNSVEVKYNNTTSIGNASTTTYTYKFELLKTDEKDQPLNGAEFELYYGSSASDSAPALTFSVDGNGNYVFDPEGTVTHIVPTGNTASAKILGLDNASYMLREVVVPSGYNKAADQTVTGLTKETNTTDDPSTVAFGKTTIKNQMGVELPSTGGIGTTIFYVVGSLLVIGCGIVLVSRRRMRDK